MAFIDTCSFKTRARFPAERSGFILLPVVITLTLIAVLAFMLSRQGAINAGEAVREHQPDVARYVAEAGFNHALWQANTANCTGYTDLTDISLGTHTYSVTITPASGSPVVIQSTSTHEQGAVYSLSRPATKIFQPPNNLTLQLGTDAGRDTPIDALYVTSDFGISDLKVSNDPSRLVHGLVYFDLSKLPADITILSAQLQLYQKSKIDPINDATIDIYRVTQDWIEGSHSGIGVADGATWESSDGSQNWDDGSGGNAPGGSYNAISTARVEIDNNIGVFRRWDITALVQGWASGIYPNQGLLLKGSGTLHVDFASKENATVANRPKLTIIYACECGKICKESTPESSCDADYIPTSKISEFSTVGYGSDNVKGLTYYPEGLVFNGVASPSGGAWISVNDNSDTIFMTDVNGALLTSIASPVSRPTGIAYVGEGIHAGQFALMDYFKNSTFWMDGNGSIVSTVSGPTNNPVGVTYIQTTADGSYDDTLAVINSNRIAYLVDQNGSILKTLDVSAFTTSVEDITHIPNTDKLLVVDRTLLEDIVIDFNGSELTRYDIAVYGAMTPNDIAFNPLTCDQAIADSGTDSVMKLNYVPTLPIAHWKLDETEGTIAVDSAGGHDGTVYGGSWGAGQVDGGLSFDGNDSIRVSHSDDLSLTTSFTLSAWFKADALPSNTAQTLIVKEVNINDSNYWLGTWGDELNFGYSIGGAWNETVTSGINLQTNTWYHVSVSYDSNGNRVKYFLDGVEVLNATMPSPPTPNTAQLRIGSTSAGEYWRGVLDDIRIYDSVLNAAEVKNLSESGG